MHLWRVLIVFLILGCLGKACTAQSSPAQTNKVQTTKLACHLYGQANSGGNAYNAGHTCPIQDIEHLDRSFRQGDFICCGGGATSPASNADIPPGLEVRVSGGYYWSTSAPSLQGDTFSIHLYCGPAASGGPGCNVSVDVIAHYIFEVAAQKSPDATPPATEAKTSTPQPQMPAQSQTDKPLYGIGLDKLLAYAFGVIFVVVMLGIAIFDRNPPPHSIFIYRVILALAAAGVGAVLPGLIDVNIGAAVRAGGAAAFFVIIYFLKPANLVTNPNQDKTVQG